MEKIVKLVRKYGNGAHIVVPSEWIGLEVVVRPVSIGETIISVLGKNLEYVKGIYIYGSYARGDYDDLSDIDILILVKQDCRDKVLKSVKKIKEIDDRLEIEVLSDIGDNILLVKNAIEEGRIILDRNGTYNKINKLKIKKWYITEEIKKLRGYLDQMNIEGDVYDVCYVLYYIYRVVSYIAKVLEVECDIDKISLIRKIYRREKAGIRLKPEIKKEEIRDVKGEIGKLLIKLDKKNGEKA